MKYRVLILWCVYIGAIYLSAAARDSSVGRAVDCSMRMYGYPSVAGSIPAREILCVRS